MRLKDMIQVTDRNCTVCMVTNPDDSLHKWILQSKSTLSECPYPDRTLPMAYAIYCHAPTCCNAEAVFNIHWPTDIQYPIWLCGKPVAASKTETMLFYCGSSRHVGSRKAKLCELGEWHVLYRCSIAILGVVVCYHE